jgi:hypothetical protein
MLHVKSKIEPGVYDYINPFEKHGDPSLQYCNQTNP